MEINPLQYPIGKFIAPEVITPEIRANWIKTIADFPDLLADLAAKLTEQTLKKAYRPDGWTARQVIHHMFDSHMNCYIRFKKALNEENPTIMPYSENDWAHMIDGNEAPIEWSITGVKAVHQRWVYLMQTLQEPDWSKTYFHPERDINYRLDRVLGIYAWHCMHHLKHIESVL